MMDNHDNGSLTPSLSRDIWIEIIGQFRFDVLDNPFTRQVKRATLRALSLVSRELTPLSQSEKWRTVSSARHIAKYIINAEGSNVVVGTPAKFLRKSLDAKHKTQVLKMLSYTKAFVFQASSDDEDLYWEFVLMATGCCPVFFNLDTIIVDLNAFRSLSVQKIFSMIASPSIKRVIYHSWRQGDERFVLHLHSNLRLQNAPVTSVEVLQQSRISACIAPRLLYTVAPGISLNINSLYLTPSDGGLPAWFLALSSSPNLVDLRMVVDFSNNLGPPPNPPLIGGEKFQFAKLQRLEIHVSQLYDLLSFLDCPSLVAISLKLESVQDWSTILRPVTYFPRMEDLSIRISEKSPARSLRLKDLLPVIDSLIPLRNLSVLGATLRWMEGDIVRILATHTSLRSLIISGSKSTPLPLSTFFPIQSIRLETICLPIDLSGVASLQAPLVWPEITTLKRFIVWDENMIPDSMKDKLKLAEFICRIFPHAKISSLDENRGTKGWRSVEDLEALRHYISCRVPDANLNVIRS